MTSSTPPQAGRSVVVALFESEAAARRALSGLQAFGIAASQTGLLVPGHAGPGGRVPAADVNGLLMAANQAGDLSGVLLSMGVPDGEARFYAQEVAAGRTLVVADAGHSFAAARQALLRAGGYDVESRGEALARPDSAGTAGQSTPLPIDLTARWEDVASRYEMLFDQHYGTTDLTWAQVEPVYRWAWQRANDARYRGRPWSEVAAVVQREWPLVEGEGVLSWTDAQGPIRDVWEDVAAEAALPEGGQDRRIPRQGNDQSVAARDIGRAS